MTEGKNKYIIFQPDGHYGFPEPVFSDSFVIPHPWEKLFEMYGESGCSAYGMNEGFNGVEEEDPGLFEDYGWSDLYNYTFIISAESTNGESAEDAIYRSYHELAGDGYDTSQEAPDASKHTIVEDLSDFMTKRGFIMIGIGKDLSSSFFEGTEDLSKGEILDFIKDKELINSESLISILISLGNKNDQALIKDKAEEIASSRGDISVEEILAAMAAGRMQRRTF
jgi:hypothetical protein